MPNSFFQFKEFRIEQAESGMKVTTDACLFGAWCATQLSKDLTQSRTLLDIGTGTGLLSLMIAQKNSKDKIDAIEINRNANNEAITNFESSSWKNQINPKHISLQDHKAAPYDVIVCNPPFFTSSQRGEDLNKNQAIHSDSLKMEDLLENTLRLLKEDGNLYLLYPEREMNEFIDFSKPYGLYVHKQIAVRNQINKPVFRIMASFSKTTDQEIMQELIIKSSDNQYTEESWRLLSPYYLEYNAPKH